MSPSLDELRIELAEGFDQIGLRDHHGVDVLIDTRHFIETGGEQLDTAPMAAAEWRPCWMRCRALTTGEIARQLRAMTRLWRGTDIERGMSPRRNAALVETAIRL